MSTVAPRNVALRSGEICTLRSADVGDADSLLALARAVSVDSEYAVTRLHEIKSTADEQRKWIVEHAEHDGRIAVVATVDGAVVGICEFSGGEQERVAHTGSLWLSVAAAWRRRGVGRGLMTALLDWAAAHPLIEKVSLAVVEDNAPAVALYRSLGFVEQGRRPKHIRWGPGRYSADLLMYKMVKP